MMRKALARSGRKLAATVQCSVRTILTKQCIERKEKYDAFPVIYSNINVTRKSPCGTLGTVVLLKKPVRRSIESLSSCLPLGVEK